MTNFNNIHTIIHILQLINTPSSLLSGAPHRMTRAVDVFSMGCLLHYLLTGGLHPFGGEYERDQNIMLDRHSLKALGHLPEMRHLIGCMIQQVRVGCVGWFA